jgi:uncharacterized Tic20 family protein
MELIQASIFFVILSTAVGVGLFCLFKMLFFRQLSPDTRDLAGSGLFRIASIFGIVVGLVFSQLVAGFSSVQDRINREAASLLTIGKLLNEFGGEQATALISDTQIYLEDLHRKLANTNKSDNSAVDKAAMYLHLRAGDLVPAAPIQELIKAQIIQQTDILIKSQIQRVDKSLNKGMVAFMVYFIVCFILILYLMSINRINWQNIMIISVFSGFMGLTAIIMFALSDPFQAPGKVSANSYLEASNYIKNNILSN